MPEHDFLRVLAAWIKDIAVFCGVVKPHLFAIAEFLLFVVGLLTVVVLSVRGHREPQRTAALHAKPMVDRRARAK